MLRMEVTPHSTTHMRAEESIHAMSNRMGGSKAEFSECTQLLRSSLASNPGFLFQSLSHSFGTESLGSKLGQVLLIKSKIEYGRRLTACICK